MKRTGSRGAGFSLIELLAVLAVLSILAGIVLMPAIGAVRRKATIAASKAQLQAYVSAVRMFRNEYGFYPFPEAQSGTGVSVNAVEDGFVATLSGRDVTGATVAAGGNRRAINFHSFPEREFFVRADGSADALELADGFNNRRLFIVIDGDGDGRVEVPEATGSGVRVLRVPLTAYARADDSIGAPGYCLHD